MDGYLEEAASSHQGKSPRSSSSQAATQSLSDSEEEEESESSSSALSNFRKQWEAELQKIAVTGKQNNTSTQLPPSSPALPASFPPKHKSSLDSPVAGLPGTLSEVGTIEEEAKRLFLMGVSFERRGELYDAVRYYRRAMQLVPDIENRVNQSDNFGSGQESTNDSDHEIVDGDEIVTGDENEEGPLLVRLLQLIEANGWNFFEKARPDTKVHISDIPVEIILYILRWAISNELDLRTLDTLSSVSRGFYCICRDESLWKMACERVWPVCDVLGSDFSTYREMFLSRPRVRFDGCYISRVTYVRPGEHSFQDQSYRPWHMVEYYRYIRFFSDGNVLFLTTAEKPGVTVSALRDRKPRNISIMRGRYNLYGNNVVSAVVTKTKTIAVLVDGDGRKNSSRHLKSPPQQDTTFHMDFEIEGMRGRGRSNWVLRWSGHYVRITNSVSGGRGNNRNVNAELNANTGLTSTFELIPSLYPPLYFSRVKSYTATAQGILK